MNRKKGSNQEIVIGKQLGKLEKRVEKNTSAEKRPLYWSIE